MLSQTAPWWSQSEGGLHFHALGALIIQTRRRPPHPCKGRLGAPKAKEGPTPMRRGPRLTQSKGGLVPMQWGPR